MTRVRRGNLPAEVNGFVGRRSDLARLRRSLEAHRAVTLTGTGGIGKSRLARRTAAEVSGAFPDGVWLVDLGDLADGPLLPSTVVAGVGLRDDGGTPVEQRLVDHFCPMQALLVLDGCDRVVDAAADLVDRLLRSAPGLRVLCTSRRPLHASGEAVLPVGPLSLPDDDHEMSAAALSRYDATALFVDRASTVNPGLTPSDGTAAVISRICRRLDGLPLAIEFAADRLDVLSLGQLAERLDDAYRLLNTSRRGLPSRQRTLQTLVDSSYELCAPAEKLLWARLAVFTGRFDLTAVEHVCTGGRIDEEGVLDLVAGLIDKSVLSRDDHPGGSWYRLPGLLRDYGRQRLVEVGDWDQVRERHGRWCLQLAESSAEGLLSPRSDDWVEKLRGNHDNVRAALELCLEDSRRGGDALRLAASLWHYWIMAGRVAEGRAWLDRALMAEPQPVAARALALAVGAYLAILDEDPVAEDLLKSARVLERDLAGPGLTGDLLFVEGLLELHRGDLTASAGALERALEALQARHDLMGASRTLCLLATVHTLRGDTSRGLRCCEQFLDTPAAAGENWGRAYVYAVMALARSQEGDRVGALQDLRRSATLLRHFDDSFGMSWCVESGALVCAAVGRHGDAAVLLGSAAGHRALPLAMAERLGRAAETVREALGEVEFDRLMADGAALSLRAAVDLVAGGPESSTSRREDSGAQPLSQREWEVAELVAAGRSNKEIAAALVISTRTAEGHVQRILGKLDFLSRAQIAAWVAEQRAVSQPDARGGRGSR